MSKKPIIFFNKTYFIWMFSHCLFSLFLASLLFPLLGFCEFWEFVGILLMGPLFLLSFFIVGICNTLIHNFVDLYSLYINLCALLLSILVLPKIILKFKTMKNKILVIVLWGLIPFFFILMLERSLV